MMIQADDDTSSGAGSNKSSVAADNEIKKIDAAQLKRYYDCERNPSFLRQFWASYRRRLIFFYQDTSQMFLMFGPLTFIIIEILFITIILNAIVRLSGEGDADYYRD